jgi:hypothetical protein
MNSNNFQSTVARSNGRSARDAYVVKLPTTPKMSPRTLPHVGLIGDDSVFTREICLAGLMSSIVIIPIPLRFPYRSHFAGKKILQSIDALIVDFDLKESNGIEAAETINVFYKRVPTVMISESMNFDRTSGDLPRYVDLFLPKNVGAQHILNQAKNLVRTSAGRLIA